MNLRSLCCAAAACAALAVPIPSRAADPVAPAGHRADAPVQVLTVGGGAVTGLHYPLAGALCRVVNAGEGDGPRCLVDPRDGSIDNLEALRAGGIDMAVVQSDWPFLAHQGLGRFEPDGPFTDLRAVAVLNVEAVTVLARPEAGIAGLSDLKGKRVNLGPAGSALRAVGDMLLTAAGLAPAKLALAGDLPPDMQAQALCTGDLDAALFVVGHPNAAVNEAITGCGAVPVPITGAVAEAVRKDRPWLVRTSVPAAAYPGLAEDVPSVGPAALLVTTEEMEPAVVTSIVRGLVEHLEPFRNEHPALARLERRDLPPAALGVPMHPAAEAAYRELELIK